MKKILVFFSLIGFLAAGIHPHPLQEEEMPHPQIRTKEEEKTGWSYNPGGRRDPFRDLLAGREVKEKALVGGVPEISIDDIKLIGIVEAEGKYTAIINGPQGFPFFIKSGDQFADGYVHSIEASQVIFRKTKERGIPLVKPKDIVKEIYPEER
ncbi:MAG: hypothetical protein ACLFVG_06325 [Candidatus Aminicenantes bacterium]